MPGPDSDGGFLETETYDRHDPDDAPLDSEVDFDDDTGDDQEPLDEVEAIEVGANLDDPEKLSPE